MNLCGCRARKNFFSIFIVALLLFMDGTMNESGRSVNQTWYQSSSPRVCGVPLQPTEALPFQPSLSSCRDSGASLHSSQSLCSAFPLGWCLRCTTPQQRCGSSLRKGAHLSLVRNILVQRVHQTCSHWCQIPLLSIHIELGMNLAVRDRSQGRELSRSPMYKCQRCLINLHMPWGSLWLLPFRSGEGREGEVAPCQWEGAMQ